MRYEPGPKVKCALHQGFPHPQSSDFLPTTPIFFGMLDFFSRFDHGLVMAQISIRGTRSKCHILLRQRAHSKLRCKKDVSLV